jgi:hypothetical protein
MREANLLKLNDLREVFWPLLELDTPPKLNDVKVDDLNLQDPDLNLAFSLANDCYSNEEKRLSQVESKSIVFIGSFSVAISIILSVANNIVNKSQPFNFISISTACILIISVIYLCRALWFSIKALERGTYSRIGYADFINDKNDRSNYKKELITRIINYTERNSIVINEKVDSMTMAQAYFKRSVVSILIFTILLVIYSIFNTSETLKLITKVIAPILKINIWLIISVVLFVCLIVCIILLMKLKHEFKRIRHIESVK